MINKSETTLKIISVSKIEIKHPDKKPDFVTGAFSDGILIDGFLFISGQAAVDFTTSKFVLGTIEEETRRTLENIKAVVEAAGASMDDIIKCTTYLENIKDFDRYNDIYSQYFQDIKPARTTVQSGLGRGIKVEIDCIARLPSPSL